MTETPNQNFSYRDVPRIIVRHKRKVLLFFSATLAVVVVLILWGPHKYSSEAKLFVRIGHESLALDPTATTGQTVQMQVTRQQEINSLMEILRSRALAEKVVETVTPQAIFAPYEHNWLLDAKRYLASHLRGFVTSLSRDSGKPATPSGHDGAYEYEDAIGYVQAMLDISAGRDSNVITISCRAQSPKLAQRVVASLVTAYVHEHTQFNRTTGSDEFFEEQSELIRQRLSETERALRDLKNEKGIVTIQGQLGMLETQKLEIQGEQLRIARDIASSEASVRSLRQITDSLDKLVMAMREEGHSNVAADTMRSQLYDLEIREGELLSKYAQDHTLVRAVREQLAEVRRVLNKEKGTRTHQQFAINPNRQETQLAMLRMETQLASLKKTSESLATQHVGLVEEIRELNSHALKIAELQRQVDLLDKSYGTYSENLEQARIDAALAQERITNVNVVQQAALANKPVSPNKRVMAVLGLLVATSGAMGLALVAEVSDRRLKSPAEVEAALSVTVIASIPRSSKQCVYV